MSQRFTGTTFRLALKGVRTLGVFAMNTAIGGAVHEQTQREHPTPPPSPKKEAVKRQFQTRSI